MKEFAKQVQLNLDKMCATGKLLEDNKLSKIYKSFSKEYKIIVAEHNENYIKAQILGSQNAEKYARQFYHDDIEIYESFFIIILDTMKNTIGWVKISQGGTAGTVVDPKFVAKYSIDLMASAIVMVHNHPSGNFKPSNSDINLTKKIIEGLKLFDIAVLDHIIITKDSYLSFADEGLL